MSSMGELTFFLGLQVKQKDDGIFISQDKYMADILKKFDFVSMKTASTPIETNKALLKDEEAEDVDVYLYRSLMYLTASRPDIMFAVCACARFQVTSKVSHLHAVKRIFRYLKGQPKLGLWYPRDSPFDLEAFSDSDYARASLDRKSTTGGCQFLSKRLISWQCKKQTIVANSTTEAEYVAAANCCRQVLWIQNHMLDYGFNLMNTKIYIDNESTICIVKNPVFQSKTKHIEIRHHFIRDSYEKRLIQVIKIHTDHNVSNLLTKSFDVSSIRDKFGNKTSSCKVNTARQAKHIEYMSRMDGRTCNIKQKCVKSQIPKIGRDTKIPQSGGPPEKVGDEAVHKVLGDRMERVTTIASSLEVEQDSVKSLESDLKQTKLTYGAAYTKLIMKVKKLENRIKSSKARRRVKLIVSEDEEVYIVEHDISTAYVPVSTAGVEVSTVSPEVKTAAESLVYIRRSAVKRKDKGKAIMKEAEPVQKKTKLQLEQERLGYEEALRLQEQLDKEERKRISRVHEEANTFNAEEWDNIQAQIKADEELAQKLQAEERGKFSEVEKARLLVEMINERKRLFAQQRAEQRRNKPMTQAQQRTYMCNYIKNMGSHTLQQLKKLSFDEIKELFETTMKRVKDFVPMESDRLVPKISTGSSKRTAETELEHEGSKRQKTNEEQSAEEEKELSKEELQKLMMIVPVEEVYVEALQVKYPIIDWEVYSEDTRKYWKIIRVGNHTEAYQTFDDMLKKFDRDDLDKLWSLVKERFSSTDPTDDKERTLWVELKRLFEPDIDDILWKLQRYMHDPLTWRLYDTCGVHHVSTDRGHDIFMLVEKDYPLT
ncbi:hypothetical protein Tco_0134468 [Tanacetum coccineum]